jgi:hypothetical protein
MPFFRDYFPEYEHLIAFAGDSFWDAKNHRRKNEIIYSKSVFGCGVELLMLSAERIVFHSLFCSGLWARTLSARGESHEKSGLDSLGGDLFCATNLDPVEPDPFYAITMAHRIEFMRRIFAHCGPSYECKVAVAISGTQAVHFETFLPLAFDLQEAIKIFPENRHTQTGAKKLFSSHKSEGVGNAQ